MKPTGTYYVTPSEGEPYRVVLEAVADGWSAAVEGDGRRWVFLIRPGTGDGRAWVGERLRRWWWSGGALFLDGLEHPLRVESETHHRVRGIRSAGPADRRASELRAPMPGLVVAVEVEEGARVEAGQGVVVIEAMKMENEIVAPAPGTVRGIAVAAGDAVERNALVCRIEPDGERPA